MIFDHLKCHVTFIRRCRWKSSLYKDIKKRKQVYGIYEECNEPVNLTQEKNGVNLIMLKDLSVQQI